MNFSKISYLLSFLEFKLFLLTLTTKTVSVHTKIIISFQAFFLIPLITINILKLDVYSDVVKTDLFSVPSASLSLCLQVGNYKRAVKRFDDGHRLCNDLMGCLQERAKIEKSYGDQLTTWSKRWRQLIEKGTLCFQFAYALFTQYDVCLVVIFVCMFLH